MTERFKDRQEAGELLGEKLAGYRGQPDLIVLALPRGGVPVAVEVAKRLGAPLDLFVVRKLGLPEHPELAMGAIASGGVRVVNSDVVNTLRMPEAVIDAVATKEMQELNRRERAYRGNLPPPDVAGKTVIIVDDGIATGSTMMAAISALRQLNAALVVVATPTVARATYLYLREKADDVVAVIVPDTFYGVGQFYQDFSQTSDEEVHRLLGLMNPKGTPAAA